MNDKSMREEESHNNDQKEKAPMGQRDKGLLGIICTFILASVMIVFFKNKNKGA